MNYFEALFKSLPGVVNLGVIFGIMAIGVFITYKILDFADLSVDGSFATGGAMFGILVTTGTDPALAFLLAFVAGTLAGLITAVIHCYCGIPGILAGILTQLMLYSINLFILGSSNLAVPSRGSLISALSKETAMGIFIAMAAVIIGVLYWFFGTKFGTSIRATGSNADMARANGINVNSRKITALMISNGIVAFAGALYSRYYGSADIGQGRGAIVIGLAAIIIGLALCKKWAKSFIVQLSFVVVGGIIYYFVYQAIALMPGVNTEWLKMFSALVVVMFLAVPYIKTHYIADWKLRRAHKALKEEK